MPRHEADREDLMAEATALRERVELAIPGEPENVVAGFRENGFFSLYFGPDPLFHFDAEGRLRRAFVAGDLYRSQGRTLSRLTRTRSGGEVHLVRYDLEPEELAQFLAEMREKLIRLQDAIERHTASVIAQVPPEAELLPRLLQSLECAVMGGLSPSILKRQERHHVTAKRQAGTDR
jgi:hypothetical protein